MVPYEGIVPYWNCFSVMQEKKMNQSQFEVTHYEKNNEEKRLKVISETIAKQIFEIIS